MELQRMIHYALPTNLLDAADRLGLLIIGEAGNWQLQPEQMDDEAMRADYRNQMRELVERDWNHPSVIGQLRTRPFVAGASVWTFNDYRSRFPDTNANGYRPWGLIDPERQPRGAYRVVKEEFATLRLTSASIAPETERIAARIDLEARADFPSRVVTGMTLRLRRASADGVSTGSFASSASAASAAASAVLASTRIPELSPGQRITLALDAPSASASLDARPRYAVDIVRPDGSVMCSLAVEATSREISQ